MPARSKPILRRGLRPFHPDNCVHIQQPGAARRLVAQRTDNQRPARHLVPKTFSLRPCSLTLLALEKVARFSLLQRERLFIRFGNFQRQSHRVATDRTSVSRWIFLRFFVCPDRTTAFHPVCPSPAKLTITVDNQRPLDHTVCAIVFNRRRILADFNLYMLPTPHASRNTLHLLTSSPDRNQQQRNNAKTSLTTKHRGAIVGTSHRKAQSRRNFLTAHHVIGLTAGDTT